MKRPTSVTLLALAVFCLSAFNLLGAASALQDYDFLNRLPLAAPPAYLVVSRLVWGLAFVVLGVGLWRLKHWGRVGTLAAFSLYVTQRWLDRFIFSRSDFARLTVPYALLVGAIGLVVVWGVLMHPRVRRSFGP